MHNSQNDLFDLRRQKKGENNPGKLALYAHSDLE